MTTRLKPALLRGGSYSCCTPHTGRRYRSATRLVLLLFSARLCQHLFMQVEEKENTQELSTPINSPRATKPSATVDGQKENGQLAATWEAQCKACLGAAQAAAVLKATP